MSGLGVSEIIVMAMVALPSLATAVVPTVVAVMLWKRQTELRKRLDHLEFALRQLEIRR
jgi:hypothetical protein